MGIVFRSLAGQVLSLTPGDLVRAPPSKSHSRSANTFPAPRSLSQFPIPSPHPTPGSDLWLPTGGYRQRLRRKLSEYWVELAWVVVEGVEGEGREDPDADADGSLVDVEEAGVKVEARRCVVRVSDAETSEAARHML